MSAARPPSPLLRPLSSVALLLGALALAACFDARTPEDAQLFCTDDEDCPDPQRCNTVSHLCGEDAPDTTAPTVLSLVIDDDDGVVADVRGDNSLVVRGAASEPLARATCTLGALTVEAETDGDAFSCALTIPEGFLLDGAQPVDVTVTDAAALSSTSSITVVLDTSAPGVEDGSVTVAITTGGVASAAAIATSTIRVGLVASELLADGGATLAIDVLGARTPLALVSQSGRVLAFQTTDDVPAPPGEHALVAVLTDRFGHASDALIIGAVPFVADDAVCARPPGVTCVDLDGDGFFAVGDCVTGDDPDDADARVFPGAPEIPGDGLDNDGVAGDEIIDELAGVFVDCASGDDANEGTRAAPFATLGAASTATVSNEQAIFLAVCDTPYTGPVPDLVERVFGGFDATTWQRTGARSVIAAPFQLGIAAADIEAGGDVQNYGASFVDSSAARMHALANTSRFTNASVDELSSTPNATVRAVDSVFGRLRIFGTTTLVRSRVRVVTEMLDTSTGVLIAVSSLLEGRDRAAIEAFGALRVALYFSTVTVLNAGANPAVFTTGLVPIDVVASVVQSNGGAVVSAPAAGLRILDSNLAGGSTLIQSGDDLVTDLAGLDACEAIGCIASAGNSNDDASGDDFHLAPGSPLRDRVSAWPDDAPASALVDFDHECRVFDDALDIGADEAR